MKHLIAVLILSQLCCVAVAGTVATAASIWYLNDTAIPNIEYDGTSLPIVHAWGGNNYYANMTERIEITDTKTRLDCQQFRTSYYSPNYFRQTDARVHSQYFVDQDTPWTLTVQYQGTINKSAHGLDITLTNASTGEVLFELEEVRPGVYSGVLPLGLYDFDCNYDFVDFQISSGAYDMAQILMVFELDTYACPTLDGDFDGDGDVDLSDLAVMLSNFAITCP